MTHTSQSAERFIVLTILCGVVAVGYAILQQHAAHYLQSATLLILALGAARLEYEVAGCEMEVSPHSRPVPGILGGANHANP